MDIPQELVDLAARWDELKRWERRELGQTLRRLGLSYGRIREVIPVPRGTLSGWCRDLPLTEEQLQLIRTVGSNREAGRAKAGKLLRERNLARIAAIRRAGGDEAGLLISDPWWVSGVVAYWAEGAKRTNALKFSNSDPDLVRLFITWADRYLCVGRDRLTVVLHLHDGQNEAERKSFWSEVTSIPLEQFRKTFWKEEGTGHRKNVLYNGTASIRVRRSTDLFHRVSGWIEFMARTYQDDR